MNHTRQYIWQNKGGDKKHLISNSKWKGGRSVIIGSGRRLITYHIDITYQLKDSLRAAGSALLVLHEVDTATKSLIGHISRTGRRKPFFQVFY